MRQIAEAAGISKPLLYHYFPSKIELFKAAVAEQAAELQRMIEPAGDGTPFEQLSRSLDAYLGWIEGNARAWTKLMQSAATLPDATALRMPARSAFSSARGTNERSFNRRCWPSIVRTSTSDAPL